MADDDDHDFPTEATLRRSLHSLDEVRHDPDFMNDPGFIRAREKIAEIVDHIRDSDVDPREIFSLEAMLREADPKRRARKLRDALNNPRLDAALAEARAAGVPGLGEPVRDSAPSPWAKARPKLVRIDKADLPSASVMTASVPETPPAAVTPERASHGRNLWPASKTWAGAILAVFGPVILMYVLFVRPSQEVREGDRKATSASAVASAPSTIVSALSSQPVGTAPPATSSDAVPPEAAAQTVSSSSTTPRSRAEKPRLVVPTVRSDALDPPPIAAPPPNPASSSTYVPTQPRIKF